VLHFAIDRVTAEMSNGAPAGAACAGMAANSTALATCLGGQYATWVNAFVSALESYQNVLVWGIDYGIQGPSSTTGLYPSFWQAAYPPILSQLQSYTYTSPSGRALLMLESSFGGIWPPCPPLPAYPNVQPILSLVHWTYPGSGDYTCSGSGDSSYSVNGYQWNWQPAPNGIFSEQELVDFWQEQSPVSIQPDMWAFQMYNASAADLEAGLECVAGVANSVCASSTQAIPFSKMLVSEVATGSSFASSPIGNGFATQIDSQDPTTNAAGQAQWLTDTLCVFSRHSIPAFGWYGLYDSASWWEANFSYSGAQLAGDGYWGLSSEVSSYGNKPAWTAFLGYPSNCPSGTLPPTPVVALYADATYYTQGDTGIINYTAADVSSLSLNETPDSNLYSCETADGIQTASTPLVGSCTSLYVKMAYTTQEITLSGSNADVDNSRYSGSPTTGSDTISVTVGPNPIIGGIEDNNTGATCNYTQNPSCTITINQDDIVSIYGQGFALSACRSRFTSTRANGAAPQE
jgi:hypothetical protein